MDKLKKGSLYLGQYQEIKVYIHWTFIILPIWVAIVNYNAGYGVSTIIWNILLLLGVFFCVTLHEFGHALTAKKYHFKTKHITLLPIGGVASFEAIPEKPKQEFLVAIAGPMVNFFIAGLLAIIFYFSGTLIRPMSSLIPAADNFFYLLMVVNLFIALFNLIPAFPMDGGRILRALLSFKMERREATKIASALGQFMAVIFIVFGFFYNWFLIFIGIFVYLGARAELTIVQSTFALKDHTVNDIVMKEYHKLSPDDTLDFAIKAMLNSQVRNFLVLENDEVVGTLNRQQIFGAVDGKFDEATPIRQIMTKDVKIINPSMPLNDLYTKLNQESDKNQLLAVMDNDKIIGVLDLENLMEFIIVEQSRDKKSVA